MKPSHVFFSVVMLSFFWIAQPQESNSTNPTTTAPPTHNTTKTSSGVIEVQVPKIIVMICLLGIPPFTMSSHTVMIYILLFSSKRHKYTNIFYKLIMTLSLVVIYWGAYFWYMGWCQYLGQCPFGEQGNIIIATVAQYLFYVCMNMNLLVAFNRFSAVVLCQIHDKVFSNFMGLFYIGIVLAMSAAQNIHGFKYLMKYYTDLGTFGYLHTPDEDTLHIFVCIELGFVYAVHVIIYVLYAWSFISYKRQATMTSHHKKERRLLIQALISGSPCFFMMTFHHVIRFPLMELISGEICVGIDPIIYVWFNREIRADFLEIFGLKKWRRNMSGQRINPMPKQPVANSLMNGTGGTGGTGETGDRSPTTGLSLAMGPSTRPTTAPA